MSTTIAPATRTTDRTVAAAGATAFGAAPTSTTASWTEIDDRLTVGNASGNYAGIIEHLNGRYIATDARANVIGTFDTRREAQASLEPGSVERTLQRRYRRQAVLEAVAGITAASATLVALVGLATAHII